MNNIKESVRAIGTLFVFVVPIVLIISSYTVKLSYFGGYFFLIFEIFQFIGLTSLIGTNSPPLYLKFSSFFEWSNFLFTTSETVEATDGTLMITNVADLIGSAFEEERVLLYKHIGISFVDNL